MDQVSCVDRCRRRRRLITSVILHIFIIYCITTMSVMCTRTDVIEEIYDFLRAQCLHNNTIS